MKLKYKIGNVLKHTCECHDCSHVRKNRIITIRDKDNQRERYNVDNGTWSEGFLDKHFELINGGKKKMKYKVGDKIKGLSADIEGCEGIIHKVCEHGYDIKLTKVGNESFHGEEEWMVGKIISRGTFWEDSIESLNSKKLPTTHLVVYDLTDRNPIKKATSEPEAKEIALELLENPDVVKDSIRIYEIKSVLIPTRKVTFKKGK